MPLGALYKSLRGLIRLLRAFKWSFEDLSKAFKRPSKGGSSSVSMEEARRRTRENKGLIRPLGA